jgi:prepilin-type processing-associated H-X9-DG protein
LVVIAIISILASLLMPSLKSASEKGRQIKCASNLRQLHQAVLFYTQDNNDFVPPAFAGNLVWFFRLYPYIPNPSKTGPSGFNPSVKSPSSVYFCPSNPQYYNQVAPWKHTNYALNRYFGIDWSGGWNAVAEVVGGAGNGDRRPIQVGSVPNPSGTILFGDVLPQASGYFPYSIVSSDTASLLFAYHNGNGNWMMLDGHVAAIGSAMSKTNAFAGNGMF